MCGHGREPVADCRGRECFPGLFAQVGVGGKVSVGDGSAERGRDKLKRLRLSASGNGSAVRSADEAVLGAVQVNAFEDLPVLQPHVTLSWQRAPVVVGFRRVQDGERFDVEERHLVRAANAEVAGFGRPWDPTRPGHAAAWPTSSPATVTRNVGRTQPGTRAYFRHKVDRDRFDPIARTARRSDNGAAPESSRWASILAQWEPSTGTGTTASAVTIADAASGGLRRA